MKLLYLSCHAILEYDELRLFNEMGIDVFSPGAYVEPDNPGDPTLRPSIPGLNYNPDDLAAWHALGKPNRDNKELLTKDFVDRFDAVLIMHIPQWVFKNWPAIRHKPVIWRTIGQSIAPVEKSLSKYRKEGLKIVRYSPKENTIPGYIGGDALIRFYKDPDDYGPWNGNTESVITVAQNMKQRDTHCNFSLFERVTRPFNRALFGPGSETESYGYGKIPYEDLKQEMCDNRCYFYTGTYPASYTLNFMEAWMSGMPIVALGNKLGNASFFPKHSLYEVADLIDHGVNGFVSNKEKELQDYVHQLLNDKDLAENISINAQKKASEIFGKDKIKQQWKDFFKNLNA